MSMPPNSAFQSVVFPGENQRPKHRAFGPSPLIGLAFLLCLLATTTLDTFAQAQLNPATLAKVKKATAYLRVTLPDSSVVQGSGFFGVEPGLVLTNAHVLGMLRPESRRPLRIDVILNSGDKDEQTFRGECALHEITAPFSPKTTSVIPGVPAPPPRPDPTAPVGGPPTIGATRRRNRGRSHLPLPGERPVAISDSLVV